MRGVFFQLKRECVLQGGRKRGVGCFVYIVLQALREPHSERVLFGALCSVFQSDHPKEKRGFLNLQRVGDCFDSGHGLIRKKEGSPGKVSRGACS